MPDEPEPETVAYSSSVTLPELPAEAGYKLALDRDRAVAALTLSRNIPLQEAADVISSIMERVKLGVEDAIAQAVAETQRSPEEQAKAAEDRERWSGVHGQTVAGPESDRIER